MIEVRLENLETKVDGVASGLVQLGTQVDGLESKVDSLEGKVDGLATKVDKLETKVDRLETKVDGLETKVDGLETKFDKLDTAFGQLRRDVRHELGLAVEQIRADIKAIPDTRAYIDQRLAAGLQAIRGEFGPRLDNVELALKRRRRS